MSELSPPSPLPADDKLVKSFDALRQTATCISDLRKWFTAHPQALLGNVAMPEDATAMVNVSIRPADILNVLVNGGLLVKVNTEVVSYYVPLESLSHLMKDTSKSELFIFKHTSELTLRLNKWPFATALVAGTYVVEQISSNNRMLSLDLGEHIDEMLKRHFTGYSLARIYDMISAGFLPLTPKGTPHENDIIDMLFMSRPTHEPVDPPGDF